MASPKRPALGPFLEDAFQRYHNPSYLGTDPLCVVRQFNTAADREIAAIFAALLAYGNVKQINASLQSLFGLMQYRPAHFVANFQHPRDTKLLSTFRHRVTSGYDIAALCQSLQLAQARHPSLEHIFVNGLDPADTDIAPALGRFRETLVQPLRTLPMLADVVDSRSFRHLLPSIGASSAGKRLCMLLRWLARPDDGIDLGLWSHVPRSLLLMPLDTHVQRIAGNLGILKGRNAGLPAVRTLTGAMRKIDPDDPVRFDFALCRIGMLHECPTATRLHTCEACGLKPACARHRRLAARKRMSDAPPPTELAAD